MAGIKKWRHARSPYELFELLVEDPRIPKKEMSKIFNINLKTAEIWWNHAVERRIIIPPIFRKKCYRNFEEYFYFLKTDDPHTLYNELQESEEISYISVESGFSDLFVISKNPLKTSDTVAKGCRSDYFVTIPKDQSFQTAISAIHKKLTTLDSFEEFPSPLIHRNYAYEPWDEKDEAIFQILSNDMRISFSRVLRLAGTYSDKILKWFRRRDEFGNTITMFFPEGDSSYILLRYLIETEIDSLLIDIFSELPTSTTFCRVGKKLLISVYLPFNVESRKIIRETMSVLKREGLVTDCTNSFVEYYYRRG